MSFRYLIAFVCFSLPSIPATATVTLVFDGSFYTGLISNLANAAGVPSNSMRWGVVVSTSNGAFAGGGSAYDAYAGSPTSEGFLSFGGSTTDDYYIPGTLTFDTSGDSEGFGGTTGSAGGLIDNISNIALTGNLAGLGLGAGITQGDQFALIWFSDNTSAAGSKYGFLTDGLFVIPSDGNDNDAYLATYLGDDPIRTASNTFQSPAPIPEPSRVLFLALGGMGLLMRRRRA